MEYFSVTMNKNNQDDIVCKNSLEVTQIYLNERAIKFINSMDKFINELSIDLVHINYNIYTLNITGNMTLQNLLKYCYFIGTIASIMSTGHEIDNSCGGKILDIIMELDIPYYPRYLIKNCFKYTDFSSIRKILAISNTNKMALYGGTTQQQRYDFISSQINPDTHIIDFGCGEGYYVRKIIPKLYKNKIFCL